MVALTRMVHFEAKASVLLPHTLSHLQEYMHEALDPTKQEFRLVRILARGASGHVRCQVIRADLASAPRFRGM